MSRVKELLTEQRTVEKKPESTRCIASGCPLPATIRTDAGAVCSCHFGAKADGWPRATAVVVRFAHLWRLAREAQSAPTPDSVSAQLASDLFEAAKREGLSFGEDQREVYRKAGLNGRDFMRLRMAGEFVESAIRAEALAASDVSTITSDGAPADSRLSIAIRGLAMNLRAAA